ncbi:MAG: hypothetical protein WAU01_15660, partial [Saprospiraceae bacterium]
MNLSSVKFFLIMSFVLIVSSKSFAQEDLNPKQVDTTKTLFSSIKIRTIGLYIAPEILGGQLAGEFSGFGGVSAMLLLNNKWAIGANVNSNNRRFTPTDINSNNALRLQARSIGIRFEYSVTPHKLVHVSFPITLGYGHASVDSVASIRTDYDDDHTGNHFNRRDNRNSTSFGYIQPAINLDINLFKYGKFFVGAGYRINVKTENNSAALYQLTNSNLSGLTFQTGVKLGIFDYNIRKTSRE